MKSRKWYQITIQINESFQDLLIGQFTSLGFSGFYQEDKFLNCYLPTPQWTLKIQKEFKAILKRFGFEFPALNLNYSITLIHDENWNKTWEKQTGIIEATSNIVIKPSWIKLPNRYNKKLILHIDPKMSFGTGYHETTRLSLIMIERFLQPNMKIRDFGCGTGILGIACIKLGALSAIAIDIDEWAVNNTHENIKKNRVGSQIKVLLGSASVIPKQIFDLIVANIDFPTISRFIKLISTKTRKQGAVIFSGILTSDMQALLPLFENNSLVPAEIISENEWAAIALYRV
jgi:ribosomal protein L11 methyltransferase